MKKNILGLLLICCMGLFASCSDDDNTSGVDAGQMRVSAVLPASITTGGAEDIAGHKLRCILELWTKGEGAKLAYRNEVAVEPSAETTNLPFDLAVDAGTYDCLMWVDYIDASATATSRAEAGTVGYADKYYDTSDLRNITIKDINSLINNEAADALYYSGEVSKNSGEALVLEPEMVRPFAKVSVLEKNLREFKLLWALSASYDAASMFDVSTGKVVDGETTTAQISIPEFDSEATPDGTLFSAYIFANEESEDMGEIKLNFTTKQGQQNVTVPAGLVPLLRNQHVKVSGNMMAESPIEDTEFDIVFDIDVEDWESANSTITARPVKAKVGDFFYKDGTYSSSYIKNENNPCIGIVFAVAHGDGKAADDKVENYVASDGTKKLKEVHGWVIALKDVIDQQTKLAPSANSSLLNFEVAELPASGLGDGKADILGFKNTEVFKNERLTLSDYPIAQAIINYEATSETKAPANTSGWYWGAVKQYLTLAEEYAKVTVENKAVTNVETLSVGKSLQVLIDAGLAVRFTNAESADKDQFYWSSSIEKTVAKDMGKMYRVGLSIAIPSGYNYGQTAAWNVGNARYVRPILTF